MLTRTPENTGYIRSIVAIPNAVEVVTERNINPYNLDKDSGVLASPHLGNLSIEFRIARDREIAGVILYDWCNQPDDQGRPWVVKHKDGTIEISSPKGNKGKLAAYMEPSNGFDIAKKAMPPHLQASETPAQLFALVGKAPTYSQFVLEQEKDLLKAVTESLNHSGRGIFGRVIKANGTTSPFTQQSPIEDPYGILFQTAQHLAEATRPGGNTIPYAGDLIPKLDFTAYLLMLAGAINAGNKPKYERSRLVTYHLADAGMLSYITNLAGELNKMHELVVQEVDDPSIPERISFQLIPAVKLRPYPTRAESSRERRNN